MAVPKFYRVLRGERGTAAKTKYIEHLEGLGAVAAIGSRGKKGESQILYLKPFGVNLGATLVMQVSSLKSSYDLLKGAMGTGRIVSTLPVGRTAIKPRGFRSARVSVTSGLASTGSVKTSRLTGLKYADYGGKSYSCPFGIANNAEKYGDAIEAIRGSLSATYKRIHFIEERI